MSAKVYKLYQPNCLTFTQLVTFILLLIGLSADLFAQKGAGKEWNNWYFASGGITFNTDPPTVLDDSKMWSMENSASISDFDGNLLFYTSGDTIWNRNHEVMGTNSNSLSKIAFSCWGGSIILKQPGLNTYYYVFQAPSQEQNNSNNISLKYCIVDIDKNNGLGEIISKDNIIINFKNADAGREKLGIARHATKNAWWLVTTNDKYEFVSFLFDESGVDTNAVPSKDLYCYNGGYISFSPDTRFMGAPNGIYTFDNTTGRVTDRFGFLSQYSQHNAFSPNSRYFYYESNGSEKIYQIDLWQIVNTDKKLLESIIYNPPGQNKMHALMLAPDKKIYINSEKGKYLSVIEYPDRSGLACNLSLNKYKLTNKNFSYKEGFGLPIIPSNFKENNIKFTRKCNSLFLYFDNKTLKDSIVWEVSDKSTISTLRGDSVEYRLKNKADFQVKCITYKNGSADTTYEMIPVITIFDVSCNFTKLELCKDSIMISSRINNAEKYIWSSGDSIQTKKISKVGKYWVDSYIKSCVIRDSFEVIFPTPILIDLPDTLILCEKKTLVLRAGAGYQSYKWSNNSYDSLNEIASGGLYSVKVGNGCSDTTVNIFVKTEKCDCEIYFPNVFTPNFDVKNDSFGSETECKFISYRFQIYDRWGEKLFESDNPAKKWDGKFKNLEVQESCYFYLLNAQKNTGEWIYRNGFINLLR